MSSYTPIFSPPAFALHYFIPTLSSAALECRVMTWFQLVLVVVSMEVVVAVLLPVDKLATMA